MWFILQPCPTTIFVSASRQQKASYYHIGPRLKTHWAPVLYKLLAELLDNVELRFALAESDAQLEKTLNTFLCPMLLKLASPAENVRAKVSNPACEGSSHYIESNHGQDLTRFAFSVAPKGHWHPDAHQQADQAKAIHQVTSNGLATTVFN